MMKFFRFLFFLVLPVLLLPVLLVGFSFPWSSYENSGNPDQHPVAGFLPFKGDIALYGQGFLQLTPEGPAQEVASSNQKIHQLLLLASGGDDFHSMMRRSGFDSPTINGLAGKLKPHINLRKLPRGQEFHLTMAGSDKESALLTKAMTYLSPTKTLVLVREEETPDEFKSFQFDRPRYRELMARQGTVTSTLSETAEDAGIPFSISNRLFRLFSYDIDFQRDITLGTHFTVLYEVFFNDLNEVIDYGRILLATLETDRHSLRYFHFTPDGGKPNHFTPEGQSARTTIVKTPISASRISSRFGRRRHPVLGYTRLHKGVDFAAPRGTPVYAGGDGVIERREYHPRGYGRFIVIRHGGSYKTLYAHLNHFNRGTSVGQSVRQGSVIGYVGSTGLSTGPHLHYEIHYGGRPVNPLALEFPREKNLEGKNLDDFRLVVETYQQDYRTALLKDRTRSLFRLAKNHLWEGARSLLYQDSQASPPAQQTP